MAKSKAPAMPIAGGSKTHRHFGVFINDRDAGRADFSQHTGRNILSESLRTNDRFAEPGRSFLCDCANDENPDRVLV